ncbi:MAG: hypothetical protein R2852_09485 [Bacteroidia bacterium]
MSLKFVCLFVFGFILSSGFAQETPPINKYFIILTPYQSPGKIIKEGKRIFVRDSFGNKQRGIIRITSDTTLVIENLFGTIKDSFNIHELIQVRRTGPIRSIFGVYLVVAGGMHIALSTLFFGRSELGDIVGAYFLTVGVLASTGEL